MILPQFSSNLPHHVILQCERKKEKRKEELSPHTIIKDPYGYAEGRYHCCQDWRNQGIHKLIIEQQ